MNITNVSFLFVVWLPLFQRAPLLERMLLLFLLWAFVLLQMLLQEGARRLVARWLGYTPLETLIGLGKTKRLELPRGGGFSVGLVPVGLTQVSLAPERISRPRLLLLFLVPPLVSAFLLLVCLFLFDRGLGVFSLAWLSSLRSPVDIFIVVAAANFLCLLLPLPTDLTKGTVTNGLGLWRALFVPRSKLLLPSEAGAFIQAAGFYLRGDFETGFIYSKEMTERYPENVLLQMMHEDFLRELGHYEEAKRATLQSLHSSGLPPLYRGILLNNLAWIDFISQQPNLSEALKRVEEARRLTNNAAYSKGTHGALLVEMNQIEAGISLLQEALRENRFIWSKGYNLCCLALAESKRGDLNAARAYFERARQMLPEKNPFFLDTENTLKRKETEEPSKAAYRG